MSLLVPTISDLYAKIPKLVCKGKCAASCGIIVCQQAEYTAVESVRPVPPKSLFEGLECPMLEDKRCTVYAVRPLICRLWGVVKVENMRCQWGCRPERWLSDAEAKALIAEAIAIDGRMRSLHSGFEVGMAAAGDSGSSVVDANRVGSHIWSQGR